MKWSGDSQVLQQFLTGATIRVRSGVTEFFRKLISTAAFEAFEVADSTADDNRVVVTGTE
jgi:hypothetical protein